MMEHNVAQELCKQNLLKVSCLCVDSTPGRPCAGLPYTETMFFYPYVYIHEDFSKRLQTQGNALQNTGP